VSKLNKYLDFIPDQEEKELLEQVEKGEFVKAKDFEKEKEDAAFAAENFLGKKRNINIRISEYDYLRLKRKSAETTIPYQTLVAAFIHEFAAGRIKLEI
jgi:predicted DNA binding CopG/RHH family protein